MKILIVDSMAGLETKYVNLIPREGDYIDMPYTPIPQVKKVILYPLKTTIERIEPSRYDVIDFDAIVYI